jgi:hypothetical protein
MGWNLGVRAPWRNAIGLAKAAHVSDCCFERYSPGPILDRSPEDPYTLSYPWVLQLGPEDWRMWYGSSVAAAASNSEIRHVIKRAYSRDGIHWLRDGRTLIDFANEEEYAIARPTVLEHRGCLYMWFACRGAQYRIGCATSRDGEIWKRCDAALGFPPSATGWDSEMTCYPCAFRYRDQLWLAYNGNDYGKTGFGLAVWEGPLECESAP